MRYLLVIGLAAAVLSVSGCNSGLGKGHQARTIAVPPPPPPPPPTTSQSSGMGKGIQNRSMSMPQQVSCNIASVSGQSFVCRTQQQSLKFTLTGTSQVFSGTTAVGIDALKAGQNVRVDYLQDNTVDRVTILP